MSQKINQTLTIPDDLRGLRFDQALAKLLPDFSRTQIQSWIKNAEITSNQKPLKTRATVKGGEIISIQASVKEQPIFAAEAIALDIIYEDEVLLVINKPAGMVVHPAAGNYQHTLLNALIHHEPHLQTLPRAGIVHRLDKDTSGLLVVAKNALAVKSLTKQLKNHTMERIYQAIVLGVLISGGTIDEPIGRHPINRLRMAVTDNNSKPAITHYRVIERYRAYTRIKVQLETGRTHQIRVHMAHIHHTILGDQTYGRLQLPKGASAELIDMLRQFKRQALHATELSLIHPVTEQTITWHAPLPDDMKQLINVLQQDQQQKDKKKDFL